MPALAQEPLACPRCRAVERHEDHGGSLRCVRGDCRHRWTLDRVKIGDRVDAACGPGADADRALVRTLDAAVDAVLQAGALSAPEILDRVRRRLQLGR